MFAGYRRTRPAIAAEAKPRPFSAADLAAVLATCHFPQRRGRGLESDQVAAARGRLDAVIAGLLFMGGMRRYGESWEISGSDDDRPTEPPSAQGVGSVEHANDRTSTARLLRSARWRGTTTGGQQSTRQ